jgi:hypothetical protein
MYRPRIRIPMLGIRQKIAIGRSRIDASQHPGLFNALY